MYLRISYAVILGFVAPEIISYCSYQQNSYDRSGNSYSNNNNSTSNYDGYGTEADMWSLGIVLYLLLAFTNQITFSSGVRPTLPPRVVSNSDSNKKGDNSSGTSYDQKHKNHNSDEHYELLVHIFEQCTEQSPQKRCTAKQLVKQLEKLKINELEFG